MYILPGNCARITLPASVARSCDRIAVRPVSATGVSGVPGVIRR